MSEQPADRVSPGAGTLQKHGVSPGAGTSQKHPPNEGELEMIKRGPNEKMEWRCHNCHILRTAHFLPLPLDFDPLPLS